jgi:uncharacterized protein
MLLCLAFSLPVLSQQMGANDSLYNAIVAHREKKNKEMKEHDSPIPLKQQKRFKGLKYFPVDLSYRVPATLVVTENTSFFKMKTTTTRLPLYRKFGEVHFQLNGTKYVLEVYQNPDLSKKEGYEDYLFIPFTDMTNGTETYEVGRYLEMRIPAPGEEVVLDFNLCYNPYCAYNSAYSCPIPPEVNHLPIKVTAGEKKYH